MRLTDEEWAELVRPAERGELYQPHENIAHRAKRGTLTDFDKEPWTGRIEWTGDWPWPYAIYLTKGFIQYGPDGGPFFAFTLKGAKRRLAREIRRGKARDAKQRATRVVFVQGEDQEEGTR